MELTITPHHKIFLSFSNLCSLVPTGADSNNIRFSITPSGATEGDVNNCLTCLLTAKIIFFFINFVLVLQLACNEKYMLILREVFSHCRCKWYWLVSTNRKKENTLLKKLYRLDTWTRHFHVYIVNKVL